MHLPDEPVRRLPPRPEDAPDRKPEPPLRGPPPVRRPWPGQHPPTPSPAA